MLILTEITDNIQAVLGGSVTTNQLQCNSSWRDITTTAILQTLGRLTHRLVATGFGNTAVSEPEIATSGGFDSTVSNSILGLSVNGGTSASWTVQLVQASLENLV